MIVIGRIAALASDVKPGVVDDFQTREFATVIAVQAGDHVADCIHAEAAQFLYRLLGPAEQIEVTLEESDLSGCHVRVAVLVALLLALDEQGSEFIVKRAGVFEMCLEERSREGVYQFRCCSHGGIAAGNRRDDGNCPRPGSEDQPPDAKEKPRGCKHPRGQLTSGDVVLLYQPV